MTRVAFIKLLIVVLVTFIICLPEFFASDQEEAHQQFFCCSNCTEQQENTTVQQENRTTQQENRTTQQENRAKQQENTTVQLQHRTKQQENRATQQENRTRAATRPNRHCCVLHDSGANPVGCKTSPPRTHALGVHWCRGRLTWLALILAVVLLVLGSVVYEVLWRTNGCRKKAVVLPISVNQPLPSLGRRLNGIVPAERTPSEVMDEVYFNGSRCTYKRSTLSPICEYEEADFASAFCPANKADRKDPTPAHALLP